MKRRYIIATLLVLPAIGGYQGSFLCAQRTPHASIMMQGGIYNATPVPFKANADISESNIPEAPILWGMDTAWDSEDNVTRGTNYITKAIMSTGRVSFQPSDLVDSDGNLSTAQKSALQSRLNHIAISGVKNVILNCDHEALNKSNYYGKPEEWYKVIKASVKYIQSKGFTVVTISPFNEPDYTSWGEGTKAHFKSIAKLISEDSELNGIRISAGNTLNCDYAAEWYNYMKPYVTEGNTHQLAGTFDNYASFWQTVRNDGNYATADELHNVGEAFIGAHYGMQTGIWWGWDGAARGEYCKAAYSGKEIGYAENRSAWTAATVYKREDGRKDAFIGSSERQATTSAFDFVATDRPVYYDGYGPVNTYTMSIPGGTAYQTGQTNAERMIQIHTGEDVPLENYAGGTYVIMNVNSKKGLTIGSENGSNITQESRKKSGTKTNNTQMWLFDPISERIGGDYSYFALCCAKDTSKVMDIKDWSTSTGGTVIGYGGTIGANEQWFTEYAGNGAYYIRSRHSGLYLEIANSSTSAGMQARQATYTGKNNQKWRFLPADANFENIAPTKPQGLTATAQSASVMLTWTDNSDADLEGYLVMRAKADSELTNADAWDVLGRMVSGNAFVDNTAQPATEYVYKIKAVDKSRNLSSASDEVTVKTLADEDRKALVACYKFENNLNDTTENLNDAVIQGTAKYTANAVNKNATALTLYGNSYLMLPNAAGMHGEMTISMWAKVGEKSTTWQRLFDFGNDTEHYFFLTTNSGSDMRVVMKNGGSEEMLKATRPTNGWHHFAVTISAEAVTLYVDGKAVGTSTTMATRITDFKPVRNYIARSQFTADPIFKGSIADLRLYNYALTADEVITVKNGDELTAINSVKAKTAASVNDGKIYNLAGQEVKGATTTGDVYIVNGRKVAMSK